MGGNLDVAYIRGMEAWAVVVMLQNAGSVEVVDKRLGRLVQLGRRVLCCIPRLRVV